MRRWTPTKHLRLFGGVRIGRAAPASAASLHVFNRDWSRRVLGQGAIVLLFTDRLEREGLETCRANWSACANPAGG